ncbi:Methylglyoxal synthase-like domain [Dillenia turbinata]|uniref:Carbamoyl phosphate synthase arginine-specific large chain, chloroplastic n=1 Tax=Dillenia turbinata TaxID=194707 RepID=A0AAN8VB50_9MAGN
MAVSSSSATPKLLLVHSKPSLCKPSSFRIFFYTKTQNFGTSVSHECRLQSKSQSLKQWNCVRSEFSSVGAFEGSKVGKRTDIKKILILGAGPIVIGQACEFDYSGTQACKALKEEGYEVILINSNPATIMTDPDMADRTYITPMTPELVEQVLEKERPDAILPTMGGQTALNLAVALAENGALKKYGVELIGAKLQAIKKAEDRDLFKQAMWNIGIKTPPSGIGTTLEECFEIADQIGEFPLIIRPAVTLGGSGGGIAYNREEFENICKSGLAASVTSQVLVEKSLLGWKEYELEVMRDLADNVVIICFIENIDPMGVHTGDSITVAPAQTLTDREYQRLRDYSIAIIREIGVECGGSNVQFAVNPNDGEVMVIEMNPRVSRSSALASKATGFPIAKMAAKLSVGFSLDQIPNDITKKTPASFEPSIDYVVTKASLFLINIPRFAFEKFPGSPAILTTQMKSVGESMALGRTFQESFQKAVRSLECGYSGWGCAKIKELDWDWEQLKYSLRVPNPDRIHAIYAAMKKGMKVDDIHELSYIDKWFLTQLKELVDVESLSHLTRDDFLEVKKRGFSDKQIAFATKSSEKERLSLGICPAYKRVDTCTAEFEANTPYMYSSYDYECESAPTQRKKVLILGGGPNRIGQGIEFDYCCCHTSFALQNAGYETIMMNSNPERVSTDYDTSDRLYFEPLTVEDVLNIIDLERPDGIIVQFGGQTPLKLALPIQQYLDERKPKCASGVGQVCIWGTSPDSIDAAEDRERFNAILKELQIEQPKGGIAKSEADALAIAMEIGYPVVVRPSYVLGGRAMEIVYSDDKLVTYLENAVEVDPERPVLIDKYLSDAIEIDVDALADSHGNVVIGGVMEHIEQAGVHSGDSSCSIPTKTIPPTCLETIRSWTIKLAKRLSVCGLMNCQYAITASRDVFLHEANPRASQTVPFVSKAIGHALAKYASLIMSGKTLHDLGFTKEVVPKHVSVKEAVLPFEKFQGCDVLLGPEMRSTGEVMGIDFEFPVAFAKAQIAAGQKLPVSGTVFISLNDLSKPHLAAIARAFLGLGFKIVSTSGTAQILELEGIPVDRVLKMHEGRPHAADMTANGQIQLMVITSSGDSLDQIDGGQLRRMALAYKVPLITTVAGALAGVEAIRSLKSSTVQMISLQDFFHETGKQSAKNLESLLNRLEIVVQPSQPIQDFPDTKNSNIQAVDNEEMEKT